MRVLVLGGTGFIGRHAAERLLAVGHEVVVFHRAGRDADLPAGVGVIEGDRNQLAASADAFRRVRPDIVVDVLAFTEAQAESLVNTFRGIARRLVILSSGDVYRAYDILFGRVPGPLEPVPLAESSSLREHLYPYRGAPLPQRYGFAWDDYEKILVERAVLRDHDLPSTVLRLPMVYGPGAHDISQRRLFPYLKRMDDNRPAILLDRRTARWRAPLGYAGDVAEAIRLAVENDRAAGQIYNVSEQDSPDMRGLVQETAAAAGWNGEIVSCDEPCPPPSLPVQMNLDQQLHMASDKIRRELGYAEKLPRSEAISKTIEWERANWPAEIDPGQFDYSAEDAILQRCFGGAAF